MTKEEAIENLKFQNEKFFGSQSESLKMAISALSESRGEWKMPIQDDGMSDIQPKTGHWIGHREHCENLGVVPSGLGAYEWCSNCDCGIDVKEWHRTNYNYCPNCGAKMAEGGDKE